MSPKEFRRLEILMPWIVILGTIVVWELVVRAFSIREFILPAPSEIFLALIQYREPIITSSLFTLVNTLIGFGIGIIVGLLLGISIGTSRLAYSGLYPVLVGINSVPKAAIVPILVLWMGIGAPPAITTAFLLCFFPIAVNVATGLATTEPELEDVLRSLGATRLDILWKVGIPRSLPYFFASLKVSITLAFVGAVISEVLASNDGIGYLMLQSASQFRTSLMFAGVTVIAAMGIATYLIFAFIERRFTGWATRRQDVVTSGGG
jgi:NitT/TauT family transport system permease protein